MQQLQLVHLLETSKSLKPILLSNCRSCSTDRVHAGLIKGTDTEWRPAGFEVAQSLLALCMSPDNASQQAMPGELSVRPKGEPSTRMPCVLSSLDRLYLRLDGFTHQP